MFEVYRGILPETTSKPALVREGREGEWWEEESGSRAGEDGKREGGEGEVVDSGFRHDYSSIQIKC